MAPEDNPADDQPEWATCAKCHDFPAELCIHCGGHDACAVETMKAREVTWRPRGTEWFDLMVRVHVRGYTLGGELYLHDEVTGLVCGPLGRLVVQRRVELPCLYCAKMLIFDSESNEARGVFDVFCPGGECEDKYAAKL